MIDSSYKFICAAFLMMILSLTLSCENSTSQDESGQSFTIEFGQGFLADRGWVVVHTANGSGVLQSKQVAAGESTTLSGITDERISLSVISIKDGGGGYIDVNTYLDIPVADLSLLGSPLHYQGSANVTLNYPSGDYNLALFSHANFSNLSYSFLDSTSRFLSSIYSLDREDLFTAYGAVYDLDNNVGLGGWLVEVPFLKLGSNSYQIPLDKPLTAKTINLSQPVNFFDITAIRGNPARRYVMFKQENINTNSIQTLLAPEFPVDEYVINGQFDGNSAIYNFRSLHTALPDEITIPSTEITFTYAQDGYSNITHTGNGDLLVGRWYKPVGSATVYWSVHASKETERIARPAMPDVVTEFIGQAVNFFPLEPTGVSAVEYENVESYQDYLDMFLKDENQVFMNYYLQRYYYHRKMYE